MIYGYIRTSRAAVDGLAGMHPETQLQALADAGVEPVNIVADVGISGSVPAGERPGWTGLDARLLRVPRFGDERFTPTCVGTAQAAVWILRILAVHPHVRGDSILKRFIILPRLGSSPRA